MIVTRRSFIAGIAAALAAPRLALPPPPPNMRDEVADNLVVFHESWDYSVIAIRTRVVLIGSTARWALLKDPQLWSAVMPEKRLHGYF